MTIAGDTSPLVVTPVSTSSKAETAGLVRSPEHRYVIDVLRALAALAVCLFHFSLPGNMDDSRLSRAVQAVTSYGHLGVAVFFVISGFVIPLSMRNWRLNSRTLRTYLGRRLLRLYPPYVIASALAVLLWWLSSLRPGFDGSRPAFTLATVLANLTLTATIFDEGWMLIVAWTLAIEVQFYIAIAFVLPMLLHGGSLLRFATLIAWVVLPLVSPGNAYLMTYAALFGMGIAVYLRMQGLLSRPLFAVVVLIATAVDWSVSGRESALAGLLTTGILFTSPAPNRILAGLGTISYSLYLVHVPIGGKVVNLGTRLPEFPGRGVLLMVAATAVSILAAVVFHRVIESRWIERSRAFGSRNRGPGPVVAEPKPSASVELTAPLERAPRVT